MCGVSLKVPSAGWSDLLPRRQHWPFLAALKLCDCEKQPGRELVAMASCWGRGEYCLERALDAEPRARAPALPFTGCGLWPKC